jgi:hypothetical protein
MSTLEIDCPNCGYRNLSEVCDYVEPDERDREPSRYWWCLSCDWKSEIFYYPALQPELGLWEPTEKPIEMTHETYRELYQLLHGLAADLPFNQKVKADLQRLETVNIVNYKPV